MLRIACNPLPKLSVAAGTGLKWVVAASLVLVTAAVEAHAQTVGDLVVVASTTDVKEGDRILRTIGRGSLFAVQAVQGKWLWPAVARPGWIDKRDVLPIDQAAEIFAAAIQKDPRDLEAIVARASIYEARQQWMPAEEDIDQALKLADIPELHATRARLYLRRGEQDKALADCEAAIGLDGKQGALYRMRGEVWNAKREYAKAIADFDEAIRLDPDDAGAFSNRAWLRATCLDASFRDPLVAVRDARTASELTAYKHYRCLSSLAAAYAESGRFGQAVKWQMRALELAPAPEKDAYRKRVDLYADEKPCRESQGVDT